LEWCSSREENLIRLLKNGGEAVSAPELASLLHTTDRQVRALINHLRKDHKLPICSTPSSGFYWPHTRAQAEHTIAQLRSRVADIELMIEGIEEGLEREFWPQLVMEYEEVG